MLITFLPNYFVNPQFIRSTYCKGGVIIDLQPEVLALIINMSCKWVLGMANTPKTQNSISKFQQELEEYYDIAFRFLSDNADHYLKSS